MELQSVDPVCFFCFRLAVYRPSRYLLHTLNGKGTQLGRTFFVKPNAG